MDRKFMLSLTSGMVGVGVDIDDLSGWDNFTTPELRDIESQLENTQTEILIEMRNRRKNNG